MPPLLPSEPPPPLAPIMLVEHVTKSGEMEWTVEHMVNSVLHLEGDGILGVRGRGGSEGGSGGISLLRRILCTTKNRFGSSDEVGL